MHIMHRRMHRHRHTQTQAQAQAQAQPYTLELGSCRNPVRTGMLRAFDSWLSGKAQRNIGRSTGICVRCAVPGCVCARPMPFTTQQSPAWAAQQSRASAAVADGARKGGARVP
jgi:hypothetical protein